MNGVKLQSGAKSVDQSTVESVFVAISGLVDRCNQFKLSPEKAAALLRQYFGRTREMFKQV
jgi:hypothetical protein